jgi:hypothetical protein
VITVCLIRFWCWLGNKEVKGLRQCVICGRVRRKSGMILTAGHTWACSKKHAKLFEDSVDMTSRGRREDRRAVGNQL